MYMLLVKEFATFEGSSMAVSFSIYLLLQFLISYLNVLFSFEFEFLVILLCAFVIFITFL